MINLAYKKDGIIHVTSDRNEVFSIPKEDFLWMDVVEVSDDERKQLEETYGIKLNLIKKRKIRHSFRFTDKDNQLIINTRLLHIDGKVIKSKPVSFILENGYLISNHNILHLSYKDMYKELEDSEILKQDGHSIFLKILEKILEYDVDIIENITSQIVKLSKTVSNQDKLDENLIYNITDLQEKLIVIRRNIIDKERVVLSISKHDSFASKKHQKMIAVIEKDIHSILDYISFDFERLEYLQDTLMGLINLRQNVIMKIFTIVSVIFLPPTLIASIYGMNFQNMPELNFPYAYPIALTVMIGLSLLALRYFKKKNWI